MSPRASYSNANKIRSLKMQTGSMLVLAIFILTVMFALAAALININQNEDAALNQEVLGTRALFMANSGADAALAGLFPLNGNVSNCSSVSATWSPADNVVGFRGCTVTRNCEAFVNNTDTQFRITSRAVCGSGEHRVSRQVEVLARNDES